MKRSVIIMFCSIMFARIYAYTSEDTPPQMHWEAAFDIGLNTDGYEFGFSGAWFPIDNIGLKLTVGMAAEIGDLYDYLEDAICGDYCDEYYDDFYDNYCRRFKFMPSIEFRTPSIFNWRQQDANFFLFLNPGLCLSPGASGSIDARWLCWQGRGGIAMSLDNLYFSPGYAYSNFALYSGDPFSVSGEYPGPDAHTHSGFLSIGVKF